MEKKIDIISIGEILIDFIGHQTDANIAGTSSYQRFLGGSPTNVAANASKMGLETFLVASCGADGLGNYIEQEVKERGISTDGLKKWSDLPTSIILVSKSTGTPDFIPYRYADCEIREEQISEDRLSGAKIFHTTCFALSRNPARETILKNAIKAKELGVKTSIDLNYSEKIWSNKVEAINVIEEYLSTNPLLKLSEDDCYRLFGEMKSDEAIFNYFHQLGVSTVCLTKGEKGVVVSDTEKGVFSKKAHKVAEVKDTTGAGDAFWTGFLYAYLKGLPLDKGIELAQKLAVIKLQNMGGGLPNDFDKDSFLDGLV
ncbi:carbohydrate kinase family protein [Bergeyella sp. RCAD1439]|uniref:carbohydrate kinase family protein n=1 Tax=Bergeyella anatis TaxID=3113737 RepID=UPI002E19A1F1|nr:sugar kinase [Bergeyella sp. RCAD1439]